MKKGLDGDKAVVMISPVDDLVMLIHKENILASGGSIASRNYITLNEDIPNVIYTRLTINCGYNIFKK